MKTQCSKNLSFQDCELAILRSAVDKAEKKQGSKTLNNPEISKMVGIVENFIKRKKLICYGGTAINNILPKQSQFYNKDVEIPDYDFFSYNALNDTKELCDIFMENGFIEVEGKSGQHHGTYKVFVNFIPIADVTFIHKKLFMSLKNEAIRVAGILYSPPNYLRLNMYLELSRPDGDVERWEKVLKRLSLLNKFFPLKSHHCDISKFQRQMDKNYDETITNKIYEIVKKTFIDQGVVFFGGYALSMYTKYMPSNYRQNVLKIPDFDVFTEEAYKTALIVKEQLLYENIKNVKIIKHDAIGDMISVNYEILLNNTESIAFIYEPIACHSYNITKEHGTNIKIATMDTMLSFYLAFLYADRPYYNKDRILCMSSYLFEVQQTNRLSQYGVLKRFSINCVGHQETVTEMRIKKSEKYRELNKNRDDPEYEEWFLRYIPGDKYIKNKKIFQQKNEKTLIKKYSNKKKWKKTKKRKNGLLDMFKFKDV